MMFKSIRDRLVEIEGEIVLSVNQKIAPSLPRAIQHFELPLFFNRLAGARLVDRSDATRTYQQTWEVAVFIGEVNIGLARELEELAYEIADKAVTIFAERPQLEYQHVGLTGVSDCVLLNASALQSPVAFPDANTARLWWRVVFTLQLEYLHNIAC